ncbi:uncharacterized protein LOC122934052 [Bufo gargarizans]|uniref:uncharacterized protein LOC122934052 n=1 Tax=Bufo gargarizans TaxID=30331 RepID=UPI001CF493CD|nr:uncharacterized protein LOC122934052 [Bufo gargarizans]
MAVEAAVLRAQGFSDAVVQTMVRARKLSSSRIYHRTWKSYFIVDGTIQENTEYEGVDVSVEDYTDTEHYITTHDGEENEETSQEIEETTFSDVIVSNENLKECGHTLGNEALEDNGFAAREDLDKGEAAPSIATQEGETLENIDIADEIVPSGIREVHETEITVTNEDVEENKAATDSADVMGEDIVNSEVSAELLEIEPQKDTSILQDETLKEDVQSHGGLICEDVTSEDLALGFYDADMLEIEDPLNSVDLTGGEKDPASDYYMDIEPVHAEDFTGNEETVSGEVAIEHLGTITSKDFVQSKEEFASSNIIKCGGVTAAEFEIVQKEEEVVSTEVAIEQGSMSYVELGATIGEGSLYEFLQDFVANTSNQGLYQATDIECGKVTTTDFEEVIQDHEDVVSSEEAIEEANLSLEEFEGPVTDLSGDFAANASEEPVAGEEAVIKKDVESEAAVVVSTEVAIEQASISFVELGATIGEGSLNDFNQDFVTSTSNPGLYRATGEVVTKEDVETETAAVEEVFCESLSADDDNDHEESGLVGSGEYSQHVLDPERDVWSQNEDTFPAAHTNTRQRETEQGKQPDSFTVYRECPTLIASTDSVYESEAPEKTDSDSEASVGSNDDLLWSYFCGSESAVQEKVVTEEIEHNTKKKQIPWHLSGSRSLSADGSPAT